MNEMIYKQNKFSMGLHISSIYWLVNCGGQHDYHQSNVLLNLANENPKEPKILQTDEPTEAKDTTPPVPNLSNISQQTYVYPADNQHFRNTYKKNTKSLMI